MQQVKAQLESKGIHDSYDQLDAKALQSGGFQSFINPDDELFMVPDSMISKIEQYCNQTGQQVPRTEGGFVRCIYESLALKYRYVIEQLQEVLGYEIEQARMVGGGLRSTILCRCTANAADKPVYAGLVEATAIGNLLEQPKGMNELDSLSDMREVVSSSLPCMEYMPEDRDRWEDAYGRFVKMIEDRQSSYITGGMRN